jgi:hypothetical protein
MASMNDSQANGGAHTQNTAPAPATPSTPAQPAQRPAQTLIGALPNAQCIIQQRPAPPAPPPRNRDTFNSQSLGRALNAHVKQVSLAPLAGDACALCAGRLGASAPEGALPYLLLSYAY